MVSRRCATTFLLGLFLLALSGNLNAQTQTVRVETAALREDRSAIVHVMVPRGQTVANAQFETSAETITLEADPDALTTTQWIIVDASGSLLNIQPAIQSALQRFLRGNSAATGMIAYDSAMNVLLPTANQDEISTFIADYSATANEPGCLVDALNVITERERDLNQSLRLLLITGELSQSAACQNTDLSALNLPAPLYVVAIADEISDDLRDLTERSGGTMVTASIRTVEARINTIRTLWTQPTYALRGQFEAEDTPENGTLRVMLSNDVTETYDLTLEMRVAPAATPQPTPIVLPTIPPRPTNTATLPDATTTPEVAAAASVDNDAPTAIPPTSSPDAPTGGIDPTIIIGVIVVLGVALMLTGVALLRRPPPPPITSTPGGQNFYADLDDATPQGGQVIVGGATPQAKEEVTEFAEPLQSTGSNARRMGATPEEDDILVTRILSDDQFKRMMDESQQGDVIGWLRLEGSETEDFVLTRQGAMIGRSQECTIIIQDDGAISRKHARIDVNSEGVPTISRLSATNPVVIDGILITNRHPLQPNDVIHLSDQTRLVYVANAQDDDFDEEETQF